MLEERAGGEWEGVGERGLRRVGLVKLRGLGRSLNGSSSDTSQQFPILRTERGRLGHLSVIESVGAIAPHRRVGQGSSLIGVAEATP